MIADDPIGRQRAISQHLIPPHARQRDGLAVAPWPVVIGDMPSALRLRGHPSFWSLRPQSPQLEGRHAERAFCRTFAVVRLSGPVPLSPHVAHQVDYQVIGRMIYPTHELSWIISPIVYRLYDYLMVFNCNDAVADGPKISVAVVARSWRKGGM